MTWIQIPANVPTEEDRRTLCAILTSLGLEVRVVKAQDRERKSVRRYIEYRLPTAEDLQAVARSASCADSSHQDSQQFHASM